MSGFEIHRYRSHLKASEEYVDVTFSYDDGQKWTGSIPIKYRRTGVDLSTEAEIRKHLRECLPHCHPSQRKAWLKEQSQFWTSKPGAAVTKAFFDALSSMKWQCVSCDFPANPNWARRTQDLKEFGYTLATDTARQCPKCHAKTTHILLVPLPRGAQTGYETWTPALRARIVKLLESYDVYEAKQATHLLPDHKFPEIRWDSETRRSSLEHLTESQIRTDFQLLSNQRNQQKREVCRACFQTGMRGYPFGIKYFYQGRHAWPKSVPKVGKAAEKGCVGCGWYDMERWRRSITARLGSG
jgi:hypothetical protein